MVFQDDNFKTVLQLPADELRLRLRYRSDCGCLCRRGSSPVGLNLSLSREDSGINKQGKYE